MDANVRSPSYYIAETDAHCPLCDRRTRVFALALPARHELRVEGRWQSVPANAFIFHISRLPRGVSGGLAVLTPDFRLARAKNRRETHWANHCQHCGRELSDDELHCEPGGFMPMSEADAGAIRLIRVDEYCELSAAGYSLEPQFFAYLRSA